MVNRQQKLALGQFYTKTNPFGTDLFREWYELCRPTCIMEPFVGAGDIYKMIQALSSSTPVLSSTAPSWIFYDIQPIAEEERVCPMDIIRRDMILDFPKETQAEMIITNPPYLAKNSATRNGHQFMSERYDDMYKEALHVCLERVGFIAAIIPESFLTANLFHHRLYAVDSLTIRMFSDTDCPVCLAYFVPATRKKDPLNYKIYRNGMYLFDYSEVKASHDALTGVSSLRVKFNDPDGTLGLIAIDDTEGESIRFLRGEEIDGKEIKISSRSRTRISGLKKIDEKILLTLNRTLHEYRRRTEDVFLTSFKGLRKDGKYRRRLDWKTAKKIITTAYAQHNGE